jgi:hypothetical protein
VVLGVSSAGVKTMRQRRAATLAMLIIVLGGFVAGCGRSSTAARVSFPSSGRAYRVLSNADRLAVAATCRDRAAARVGGAAARQVRAIDAAAVREQLDDAYTIIPEQRRPVARVCAERVPFVTPGLRLSFAGARADGADRFTYQTDSDTPLTIRGRVTPAPHGGRILAARETGGHGRFAAPIAPDGRFVMSGIRLRKIADNTFTLTIDAPPNAQRKVHFSAICLDCLGGAPPPR